MNREVHIDAPHMVTHRRRLSETLVTALMWVVYSYLWAPFISLIAWLLGVEFAYDVMVRSGGASGLIDVLIFYSVVLACIFLVVTGWSRINRYRFAGRERRQSVVDVDDVEIAEYFSLAPEKLEQMRNSRIATVIISPSGEVERIRELPLQSDPD